MTLIDPTDRRRTRRLRRAALLAAIAVQLPSPLQAAAPTLTALFPAGGRRGQTIEVDCKGEFDWPLEVWSPGLDIRVGTDPGKLEVAISPDLPADRVWIRLHNAEGVSAAVPFLIGNLPEVAEQEPNNSAAEAQPLPAAQSTVNGVLRSAGDVDGFAVSMESGQTLVAALAGNSRLGSPMDAILQIATPDGFVVAENHDANGLDPLVTFTAAEPGVYIVRVFAFPSQPNSTIGFAGGENFIYRLTLTTGPYIANAAPLAAQWDDTTTVGVMGWNLPRSVQLPVHLFGGDALAGQLECEPRGNRVFPGAQLGFIFDPGFAGSGRVRLLPHAVHREIAGGDPKSVPRLTPPTSITGIFAEPGEVDIYDFVLSTGLPLVVTAETDSVGSPAVPIMRLLKPDGSLAAETGDPGTGKETQLNFVALEDGLHRLHVHDRYRHGSDRHFYRIGAFIEQPRFELTVSTDSVVVASGNPAEIEVLVQRRSPPGGSIGPITITAADLPEGLTAEPVVSEPAGNSAGKVKLKIASDGTACSGPVRVIGTADLPFELQATARTPPKLSGSFEQIWVVGLAGPSS